MRKKILFGAILSGFLAASTASPLVLQAQPPNGAGGNFFGPPRGGPMNQADVEIVDRFDTDKNGWLNLDERSAAREFLNSEEGKALRPAGPFGRGGRGGRGFGPPNGENSEGGRPEQERPLPPEGEFPPGPPDGFPPPGEFGPLEGFPGGGPGGFGPAGGFPGGPGGRAEAETKPGPKVSISEVQPVDGELYAPNVLRTIFFEFENEDWEKELEDFHGTDVDVPAKLIVDGKEYPGAGVHFRGMSSYMMVRAGQKRSFNVSLDLVDEDQRLYGYKSLNLLNAHEDNTMMGAVLYSHIARQYIPAPKANFVRVVVNGESWGLYNNVQQFDKTFLQENFNTDKGARWKVSGSPGGGGGLEYLGDDISNYEKRYELKQGGKKAWKAFVNLTKVLNETPTAQLPDAIEPILDVDGLLWFLALDNANINCDGYWIRASDYNIYLDTSDKFHILPHDMNEAFRRPMGPGMGGFPGGQRRGAGRDGERGNDQRPREQNTEQRENGQRGPSAFAGNGGPRGFGGPGGGGIAPVDGVKLDPLVGLDDASKPLRSKILAVPKYREQYLAHVKTIAESSMDWNNIGKFVGECRDLIDEQVQADTRKFCSYEDFVRVVNDNPAADEPNSESSTRQPGPFPMGGAMSLRKFFDDRREYLLNYKYTPKE